MQSLLPCLRLGSYVFDADRLPDDVYKIRLDGIYREMDARGLKAIFVYGDAYEHAAIAYLTNFIPRMRWAIAMLPRHGEPRLLCSMSSRDMPAMRTMTWIKEVYSGWEWKWFDQWIGKLKEDTPSGAIGKIGFELMPAKLLANVERSLGNGFSLEEASDLAGGRTSKRARELALIRQGCGITQSSLAVFCDAWRESHDPEQAALAAERHARMNAAQDARTLVSFNGGRTLEPYRGNFDVRTGSLVGYVAVKYAGYWSDGFVNVGAPAGEARTARRALGALVRDIRPGQSVNALHRQTIAALDGGDLHPALSGSVGHGIGLSLHEGPEFGSDTDGEVVAGGVYTLQVGTAGKTAGVLASTMVHVTDAGTRVLVESIVE